MQAFTEGVTGIIAGEIEKLLLEEREGIDKTYKKIAEGIKLSITVDLVPTSTGMGVEYKLSYPLEEKPEPACKQTIKKKTVIDESQSAMDFK